MIDMSLIQETSLRIARSFAPEKIILFGSYANGRATEDSDVDLMVILSFEGKALDTSVSILTEIDPPFPVDIVVKKPDEAERRYREGDPLMRDAFDSGRVLYEQHGSCAV